MKNTIYSVLGLLVVINLHTASTFPTDYREDTVLPFSLSPGNVDLVKYLHNKYPDTKHSPPVSPQKKPEPYPETENGVQEYFKDEHAIFRSGRSPREAPIHIHGRQGNYRNVQSPYYSYGYENRGQPSDSHYINRRQHIHG